MRAHATRLSLIIIIIIIGVEATIVLELRSTERAEPTFHKGFYCFQKTSGYEGSEERGRKKKCDMEKNVMNKKFVLRTSFRTTLLRKLRCTNEKQSRKILIKRNGVRRNNTYENDNPSTKVITGKTAKAINELVRTTSIL